MNKFFTFLAVFAFFSVLGAGSVDAGTGQYGQYTPPTNPILIDKTVGIGQPSKTGSISYVNNLGTADPRFYPDTNVYFKIKVKNISDATLTNIQVKDVLPTYIYAIEGPGNYDSNNNVITWSYGSLSGGQEVTETVIGRVKSQSQLPQDKGLFCAVNKSMVTAGSAHDEDNAQFCIEKQVVTKDELPVVTTPKSGAPLLVYGLMSLGALGTGIFIKRKSS